MAYFRNTLVRGASGAEVAAAIIRWRVGQGYHQESGRVLFDLDLDVVRPDEDRFYLISNDEWCVILSYKEVEDNGSLFRPLSHFSVVMQLWITGKCWGYRLEESGIMTASFCSKPGVAMGDESPATTSGNLLRLVSACGRPATLPKVQRIQKRRFLFTEKACSEFAAVFNVPPAILQIYDVDKANAGITEERMVQGWKVQLLAFTATNGVPCHPVPAQGVTDSLTALDDENREELDQATTRLQRWMAWLRWLLAPVYLILWLIVIGIMIIGAIMVGLYRIPFLRRLWFGRSAGFCDRFVRELERSEPTRIVLQSDRAINTKHNCSVLVPPGAKVVPPQKFKHPVGEPVFGVELADQFISCCAYAPGRRTKWGGIQVIEQRPLEVGSFPGQFTKMRSRKYKSWLMYEWTIQTPRADYRFYIGKELKREALDTVEAMVQSFRILSSCQGAE